MFDSLSLKDREALGDEGFNAARDLVAMAEEVGALVPGSRNQAGWRRLFCRSAEYRALIRDQAERFVNVNISPRLRDHLNITLSGWLSGGAFFCLGCSRFVPLPETSRCCYCGAPPVVGGGGS